MKELLFFNKMKPFLIILISIQFLGDTIAQKRFYKDVPGWIATQMFYNGQNYSVIGLSQDSLFRHRYNFNTIDLNGELVSTYEYYNDTCLYTSLFEHSAYQDPQGNYIAGFEIYWDSIKGKLIRVASLYTLNNNFTEITNVIYFRSIFDNVMFFGMDRCGPNYYFIGQEMPGDTAWAFVCKTDTSGNIKWKRTFYYPFPNYWGGPFTKPSQIVRMTGEKHIVTFDSYTSDWGINKQFMACIDSSGNVVWEKNVKPELETYQCFLNISPINDTTVYIVWCDPMYKTSIYPYHQLNPNCSIYAVKMDIYGNYIWEKGYREYLPFSDTTWVYNKAIETDEDGFLLIGLDYSNLRSSPGIMKIHPDGSVKYIRKYDLYPENFGYIEWTTIYDILPLGNDGYYMACEFVSTPGNTFPNGIQTGLVIKTDQYGCLEPGCQWNDPTIDEPDEYHGSETTGIACPGDEENLHIWPNPVHENLFVETLVLPAVIKMYNLKGELVKQISINEKLTAISTGKLPKGIYWLQVIGNHGMKTGKVVVE